MERLISLLRAWLQANETGRDPRTSRAGEDQEQDESDDCYFDLNTQSGTVGLIE